METAQAILELGAILLAAAATGWAARRMGLPAVLGYLAVGLIVSPFTPGYVADREQIALLADVGVVLLLFEVGIEVDPLRLGRNQRGLLVAAPIQTALTTLLVAAPLTMLGFSPGAAAVLGVCVALSSSVVIVNITRSRRRTTDRPTEEALLGWSVLQDLTGVAIAIVALALLAPGGRSPAVAIASIAAFVAVAVAAAWLLPRFLRPLREEHDLFLLVSVAGGLVVAGVGAMWFGVPLALSAFVAGIAVTESPDMTEARRRLLPFRDVFAVLFFVGIGMLIDPAALARGMPWLVGLVVAVVVGKSLVAYVLARLALPDVRPAQLAVGLSQVGEFSFVLGSLLLAAGAIGSDLHAALLATVVLSIAGSTVLVRVVPRARPVESGVSGAT